MAWVTNDQIAFQGPSATDTSFTTSSGGNTFAAGDLIVLTCGVGDQTGASVDPGAFTGPAGFTTLVNQNAGSTPNNVRGGQFAKIADGTETGNFVVSWTTGDPWAWALVNYGPGYALPVDASASTASGGFSVTVSPTVTAIGAADLWVAAATVEGTTPSTTVSPAFISDSSLGSGGTYTNQPIIVVSHRVQSSAGATGTADWNGSTNNASVTMSAVFPPGSPPPSSSAVGILGLAASEW